MKIKNINGTSGNICQCSTWLDHWLEFSGQGLPNYCPEIICTEKPEVGAHVQKDNSTDSSWYIVPLCEKHNRETGKSLEISAAINLAPANVNNTCGKKKAHE